MGKKEFCTICSSPIRLFRRYQCQVCGDIVCKNCCHKEKVVRAIIRSMDKLPNVICNRCLFVRQTSQREEGISDSSAPEEPNWYEGLLLKSVELSPEPILMDMNTSQVDVDIPANAQEPYDIILSMWNGTTLSLRLESLHSSYEKDKWVTVYNSTDKRRLHLHIKYLYLAFEQSDNESLLQSFLSHKINLSNYLFVFPASDNKDPEIVSIEKVETSPTDSSLSIYWIGYLIVCFGIFVFMWCLTRSLPGCMQGGFRFAFVCGLSSAVSI